jgi:ribosome recycling factor
MTEECQFCLDETREGMTNAVIHLERELQKIRAGKATPDMLDSVKIEYYGSIMPLNQVSNISTPDARQIIVQPWDKSLLDTIDKAIMAANLGFNPINNGEVLRIIVPALTEERRKILVKQAHNETEATKVGIRSIRRIANEDAKKLKNDGTPEDDIEKLEELIQKMTDEFIAKVDKILEGKEKDIMTV